jgi:hypothetical protein
LHTVEATEEGFVATLSELTRGLAIATGLPEATVFAYGRFAREAGYISQKGRGRGAAEMTVTDAANLLIALAGTATTREAGSAVKQFRLLQTHFLLFPDSDDMFISWLKPLVPHKAGPRQLAPGLPKAQIAEEEHTLDANFGQFFEFLIDQAISGELIRTFRTIPVAEIPDALHLEHTHRDWITEELVAERGLALKEPEQKSFGEHRDLWMSIEFVRSEPEVNFKITREGLRTETLFEMTFRSKYITARKDFNVSARLGLISVMALGHLLSGKCIPKKLQTSDQLGAYLFNQPQDG